MAEVQTPATAASAAPAQNQDQAPSQGQGRFQGRGGQGGRDGRGGDRRQRRPQQEPEEKLFDERTLHIDRVARVVKGGRRFRFRALVVVGDKKSRVGIGIAKGADVTAAVTKATEVAKKSFVTVNLYKGTLPHETDAKVGGAHILIKPASAGTGLIAGGVVRTILEVAGVKNALSKSLGSTNKANTAYATLEALRLIEPAKNWITAGARKSAEREATKAAAAKTKVAPAKKAEKAEKTEEKK